MGYYDKKEIEEDYAVASKIGFKIIAWIVGLAILFGGIGLAWRYVFTDVNRVIFKQSISYNEGMLDDLAKYRFEMIQTDSKAAKTAIAELVNSRFANYDISKIKSADLRRFLSDCRSLQIQDY